MGFSTTNNKLKKIKAIMSATFLKLLTRYKIVIAVILAKTRVAIHQQL
jgi:hypothetical protein